MNPEFQPAFAAPKYRWSPRVLVLAVLGIGLLTLYPFQINPHSHPDMPNPFLLAGWAKASGTKDAFLNVLLFVPYGFGLAGLLRKRGVSGFATAAIVFATGALVSYGVEFAQFFIPGRDSGWQDVFTNSSGALIGSLTFLMCGLALLGLAQTCEAAMEKSLSVRNAAIVLVFYFACWMVLSARWQSTTALRDWDASSVLTVGGLAHPWSQHAWKGTITRLEFWDRPLPDEVAFRVTSSPFDAVVVKGSAAAWYSFSSAASWVTAHDLPPLAFRPIRGVYPRPVAGTWNGNFWLVTSSPVSNLVTRIQRTGQFSVHLEFTPAETEDMDASLVTIGPPGGVPDLEIRQASEALAFWFHHGLAPKPFDLEWSIPRGCEPNQPRNVLFSYDGSRLWAYLDGKLLYAGYRLGPATALAHHVRHPNPLELEAYRYTYYGIVFFPAGVLLGFAWRKSRGALRLLGFLLLGMALPSVLLELALVARGGQPFSAGNVGLGVLMSLIGFTWIELEGRVTEVRERAAVEFNTR